MSFHVMAAGCGGMVYRGGQGPVHCGAEPTVAGLWFARQGQTVWLAFACDVHADDLIAARELLPRDRDALNRPPRQTSHPVGRTPLAGEQEGPLARGAAAERLIDRAQAWAERHADG